MNLFHHKQGFTLIELLVVISIIGVLSTMAVVMVSSARENAKIAKAKHDTDQIAKAISLLAFDTDQWPGHQTASNPCPSGCPANNEICDTDKNGASCITKLSNNSSGLAATDGLYSNWDGPYMYSIPKAPWGYEYFFDTDYRININKQPCGCGGACTDAFVVGSYGPDGAGVPNGGPGSYGCDDIIKIIF